MQIRRASPDAVQSGGEIFAGAADTEFLWSFVTLRLQLGQELVKAIGQFLGKHFRSMRIGPDFGDGIQSLVALRAGMTGNAFRRKMRAATLRRSLIDIERIFRR